MYEIDEQQLRKWLEVFNPFMGSGITAIVAPKMVLKSRRKTVLQFSLDGNFLKEWESMYDAAEYLNCNPRYIKKTCYGEQKSYFGYIWKYKK